MYNFNISEHAIKEYHEYYELGHNKDCDSNDNDDNDNNDLSTLYFLQIDFIYKK